MGQVKALIVIDESTLSQMLAKYHGDNHRGFRPTFGYFAEKYYCFHLRKFIQNYISACPTCILNNNFKVNRDKSGNQLAFMPNELMIADFLGPLNQYRTSKGVPRYIFIAVDAHSRYGHAVVCKSTNDDECLKAWESIRDRNCGLPRKVGVDGALLKPKTKSAAFLKANGVAILHGLPHVSRHQGKAERLIGTISRLLSKFSTDKPEMKLEDLMKLTIYAYNSTPHSSLPRNLAPRDLHFRVPPSSFFDVTQRDVHKDSRLSSALEACDEVLQFEIESFLKGRQRISPTDHASRLKVGDYVMKKRTSFATNAPRKFQFRRTVQAYRIEAKIATNTWRVKSIIDGSILTLPGEQCIRMRNHDDASLKRLVNEMRCLNEAANAKTDPISLRRRRRMERSLLKEKKPVPPSLEGVEDHVAEDRINEVDDQFQKDAGTNQPGARKRKKRIKGALPVRRSERLKNS